MTLQGKRRAHAELAELSKGRKDAAAFMALADAVLVTQASAEALKAFLVATRK